MRMVPFQIIFPSRFSLREDDLALLDSQRRLLTTRASVDLQLKKLQDLPPTSALHFENVHRCYALLEGAVAEGNVRDIRRELQSISSIAVDNCNGKDYRRVQMVEDRLLAKVNLR